MAGKRERENEAIRTYTASLRAEEHGYVGERRRVYIVEQAGLPPWKADSPNPKTHQ